MQTKNKPTNFTLIIWIILIAVIIVLVALLVFSLQKNQVTNHNSGENPQITNQSQAKVNPDAVRFAADYPAVGPDNLFVYRTGEEIINILQNGTGIIFLGFKECGWCQSYAPILNEVATEAGLEKIYYFDIRQDRADNSETYQQIVALLGNNLDHDEEGRPRIFVPDVTFVKDGEIIAHNNDTSLNTTEEHGTPEEFWTSERVAAFKTVLRGYVAPLAPTFCGFECDS